MRILLIFICFSLICLSCNQNEKKKQNCLYGNQMAFNEIKKKNLYFYSKNNYSELTEYYLFKKYGVLDYIEFYPFSADSCFIKQMNKAIVNRNINLNKLSSVADSLKASEELKYEKHLQSLKKRNDRKEYLSTFVDGYISPNVDVKYPKMIYPCNRKDFNKKVINQILAIDSTFQRASFWIVIDKKGIVQKIENYKKHSEKIDNIIKESIFNTKWEPSSSVYSGRQYESRIVFYVSRRFKG